METLGEIALVEKSDMKANYHTHTVRCNHAEGTEREYIENAIRAGLKTLGFSDHCPQIFPEGVDSWFRMKPSELEGYVETLLAFREEYRGQIEILIGLEAEYYPGLWESFLDLIEPYPIDYIILGQHFLDNEYDTGIYCGRRTGDPDLLRRYCRQCTEALETGRFLYLAHPDLIYFTGSDALYEKEMAGLCRFCREKDIPLEMNLLGFREGRNYPRKHFWEIAAREGNKVILGADAHRPEHVCSPEIVEQAINYLDECGVPRRRILSGELY